MANPAFLPIDAVHNTLGSSTKWAILRELAAGESLMVSELATRTKFTSSTISKQLAALRADGVVQNPRGRLYEIVPRYFADKATRTLDFGHCLIRLDAKEPTSE